MTVEEGRGEGGRHFASAVVADEALLQDNNSVGVGRAELRAVAGVVLQAEVFVGRR